MTEETMMKGVKWYRKPEIDSSWCWSQSGAPIPDWAEQKRV